MRLVCMVVSVLLMAVSGCGPPACGQSGHSWSVGPAATASSPNDDPRAATYDFRAGQGTYEFSGKGYTDYGASEGAAP